MGGFSDTQWEMYCSAGPADADAPMRFFGPLHHARQDTTARRVLRVLLHVVDDPIPSDYWAWLDLGASLPCHIAVSEAEMTRGFLAGSVHDPGPREEELLGQGRILRLHVEVIEELYRCSAPGRSWIPLPL